MLSPQRGQGLEYLLNILNKASLQASCGPTVLSRRPVVRLQAAPLTAEAQRSLQTTWDRASGALAAGLAAVGIDTALLTTTTGRPPDGAASHLVLGDLLARCAASLMREASAPGNEFGTVASENGEVRAFWNDWMDGVGVVAGWQAIHLVNLAFADPGQLDAACTATLKAVFDARVDPFLYPMVRAAEARGIPWHAMRPGSEILSYGQGNRQQWFHGTMSNRQNRACVHLTLHKHLSIALLRDAGLPMPEHEVVKSAEEAQAAAARLGFPVVIKPDSGSRAQNIALNLTNEAAVAEAFEACHSLGMRTLVEKQYPGLPYRVTLCGGKAVAAARHAVPYVVGDGNSTLRALIDDWNKAHARAVEDHYRLPLPLKTANFTEEMNSCLREQAIGLDDFPLAGREVFLAIVPSLQRGGIHVDMTEKIHPRTLELAEEAGRILHAENLGVDFISTDITRPHEEVPLVINEVNAAASPRTHVVVPEAPRDLSDLLFAPFFPPGDSGRIPIAAAIGAEAKKPLRILEGLLAAQGETVGFADSTTATVEGYRLRPAEGAAAHPGCALLRDKRPSLAVMSFTDRDITAHGLPSDRLDAVAVTHDMIAAARDEISRGILETLVSLPGDTLVIPDTADTAWLEAAGSHRRVIRVADQTAPHAAPAADVTLVTVEELSGRTQLVVYQEGRKDPLGRLPHASDDNTATAWATALLLGLGNDAIAILRLVTEQGDGPAATTIPAGGATA